MIPGSKGSDAVDETTASEAVMTVMRLYRAIERVDTGLSSPQYRILKLAGSGEERSARMAERLAVAKPTLTAAADGLVAAGYLKREAEPGDRRVVRLCLTATGRDALEHADAAYATWLGNLLGTTGDPDGMLQALRVLDAAMDERRRARLAERSQPAELPVPQKTVPQKTVLSAAGPAARAAGAGPA